MTKVGLLLLALFLATSSASFVRRNVLSSENERIVGGNDAKPGQFPWMVSLRNSTSLEHFCGGSLIKYDWVVTAAHCVDMIDTRLNTSDLIVVAGSVKLDSGGESRDIIKIHVHEKWGQTENFLENDIALLQLKSPYKASEYIRTVDLLCVDLDVPLKCVLSGWGQTSDGGEIPNNLQMLNLTTILHKECFDLMAPVYEMVHVLKSQVCAFSKADEGACHCDSGGPLLLEDEAKKPWLLGIASWGSPCAQGLPDVYTKVASFCDWIQENTI